MVYISDTHAFLWYLTGDLRLSKRAKEVFHQAEKGKNQIIIPTIILLETIDILEKKKLIYKISQLLDIIDKSNYFLVTPLDWQLILILKDIKSHLDLHDRVIVATAELWSAFILTKDKEIKAYCPNKVIW